MSDDAKRIIVDLGAALKALERGPVVTGVRMAPDAYHYTLSWAVPRREVGHFFGIRVLEDPTLPPGEWRLEWSNKTETGLSRGPGHPGGETR